MTKIDKAFIFSVFIAIGFVILFLVLGPANRYAKSVSILVWISAGITTITGILSMFDFPEKK